MVRLLAVLGLVLLCTAVSAGAAAPDAEQLTFLSIPNGEITLPSTEFTVESHPQALPNDGFSQAEISVEITSGGAPLAGEKVKAEVIRGDGLLIRDEVVTDADGVARFKYRAGLMPETGRVKITAEKSEVTAELAIPLAPVAYLDVQLVTPEEYQAYLKRQASAAPIYKLEATAFPEQLAADGGSLCSIRARLTHVDGKPAAGVPLTAKIVSGDGDLLMDQVATDSSGIFEFYYVAGLQPGTATVQIMEPSTGLIYAQNILLVESGPARVELVYANPVSAELARKGAMLPADGSTGLTMYAKVTDLSGMPLSGVELRIEILDMQNGWIEMLDPLADMQGHVDFVYHAGTFTGPVRLRAFIADGMEYSSQLSTVNR